MKRNKNHSTLGQVVSKVIMIEYRICFLVTKRPELRKGNCDAGEGIQRDMGQIDECDFVWIPKKHDSV